MFDYVPLMAYRFTRERLKALARTEPGFPGNAESSLGTPP
jgi:hypothetical protein